MSFWPRLRRRSKGRKRSTSVAAKTNNNPYSSRDIDKYKVVHEELQAQRAQFASEKGVAVELVRFVSRSSRGWVYLPSETPSSPSTPRPSQDDEVSVSFSTGPDASQEFSLPPPALPLPPREPEAAREERKEGSSKHGAESSPVEGVVMGFDAKGDAKDAGRLVISRKLEDEAWVRISKTAAVLYVKVLVFSRALGASTAFAFTFAVVVDIWNRGKGTFRRVFSALATQLLTTLKPYLSLQQSKSTATLLRAPHKAVPQASVPEVSSASNEMKVSPVNGDSALDLRSSSFAFPVLTKDLVPTSPRFTINQKPGDSQQVGSPVDEIVPVSAPLVESNKLPTVKHCKLTSKLFKSSQDRKGENWSPSTEVSQLNDGTSTSGSSSNSPSRGKGSKKKASSILRKSSNFSEEESDEVEQPPSSLKPPKKITRSHELLFFRSPHNHKRKESTGIKEIPTMSALPSGSVQSVSRSSEFSLKAFGKRNVSRSQEFTSSAPAYPLENLALPTSTVEKLETLAFPFKAERRVHQKDRRSSLPCSPRESTPSKRGNNMSKLMAVEPSFDQYSSKGKESRSSSPSKSGKGGRSTTSSSSSSTSVSSSKASAMLAAAELKPKLRKVRTTVSQSAGSEHHGSGPELLRRVKKSPAIPTQTVELGRNQVVNREIVGSILLLSVLGFLLLGRVPAIFCTACLFLILSHLQRFFLTRLTHRDAEQLQRTSGISRLHHSISAPPELSSGNSSSHGSPAYGNSALQSSEYRKRVVIEGLLDRGNRRGGHS